MNVGYAKRDITPPVGIRLGGYASRLGRPSQAVHDPLLASAIFLASGSEEAILIHSDILGIYRKLADNIKDAVCRKIGIKANKIFFTTTHTHSGPETIIPMWPNTFPYSKEEESVFEDWINSFRDKVVEASMEACNNTSHALVKFGVAKCRNLAFNRTYRDGVIDEQVPFICFKRGGERILITNYSCHPVCNVDFGISADYPGVLYANFAREGVENFFTLGAAGDIDPIEKGRAFMSKMGFELFSAVIGSISNAHELTAERIAIEKREISLKVRNVYPLEEAKTTFMRVYEQCKDRLEDPQCMVRLLYADEEYEVAKDYRVSIETTMQTLTIGDEIAFVSVPGEMFVEFGLKIKEAAGLIGYKCIVISTCSEDYIGYIPDKRAFEIGAYEATLARWSKVTGEAGNIIVEEVVKSLKTLKEK
jgi:hypothetical protein